MDSRAAPLAHFVEILNQQLAGRFGDNRYATLVWAEYNAHSRMRDTRLESYRCGRSRLVILSDGLIDGPIDAQNAAEEEFRDER